MRRSRSLDRRCLPSRSRSVPSYRNRAHMAKNASPTRNGVSHSQEFKRQKKLASASVSEKRRRSYDRSLSSREKSVSKHRVTHSHRHSRPVSLSSSDDVKNRNYEKNRRTVPSGTRDKRTQFLSSVSLSPSTHYMRRKERRSSRSNSGFKRPTNISFRRSRSVKDRSSSLRRGNVGARRRPAMSSYIGTREPRRTLNSFVRSRYPQPALNRIDDRRFTNTTRVVPRPVTSHTTSSMRPSRRPALPYSGRSPIRRPIVSDQQNFSRSFHPRDHHRSLGHTNGRSFSTVQDNFTGLQESNTAAKAVTFFKTSTNPRKYPVNKANLSSHPGRASRLPHRPPSPIRWDHDQFSQLDAAAPKKKRPVINLYAESFTDLIVQETETQ